MGFFYMIPQAYFDKVKCYFNNDSVKAWNWFGSIQPEFGMLTPLNMLKLNRDKQVKDFIDKEMQTCR